jgi:hypothetical protein
VEHLALQTRYQPSPPPPQWVPHADNDAIKQIVEGRTPGFTTLPIVVDEKIQGQFAAPSGNLTELTVTYILSLEIAFSQLRQAVVNLEDLTGATSVDPQGRSVLWTPNTKTDIEKYVNGDPSVTIRMPMVDSPQLPTPADQQHRVGILAATIRYWEGMLKTDEQECLDLRRNLASRSTAAR